MYVAVPGATALFVFSWLFLLLLHSSGQTVAVVNVTAAFLLLVTVLVAATLFWSDCCCSQCYCCFSSCRDCCCCCCCCCCSPSPTCVTMSNYQGCFLFIPPFALSYRIYQMRVPKRSVSIFTDNWERSSVIVCLRLIWWRSCRCHHRFRSFRHLCSSAGFIKTWRASNALPTSLEVTGNSIQTDTGRNGGTMLGDVFELC